jgi:hypothetical protein
MKFIQNCFDSSKVLYILLLLTTKTYSSKAQIYRGLIEIPQLMEVPVIDGVLRPEEWSSAAFHTNFTTWTSDQYIPEKTEVYLGFDEDNMYACFIGHFMDDKLFADFIEEKKPIDSHMWGRTYFGIDLYGPGVSLQIKAGPTLSRMDLLNGDLSWNGNWKFQSSVKKGYWTGEFKIPFSELGLISPPENETWEIQLNHSNPSGISSHWNGNIKFVANKPIHAHFEKWPEPVPGNNVLEVKTKNFSKIDTSLNFEIRLLPLRNKPDFFDQQGQNYNLKNITSEINHKPIIYTYSKQIGRDENTIELEYDLPYEGSYHATVSCYNSNGEAIGSTNGFTFTVFPLKEKIQQIEKLLGRCIMRIESFPSNSQSFYKTKARLLNDDLLTLKKYIQFASESKIISHKVNDLLERAQQFYHQVFSSNNANFNTNNTFGIALTNSLKKIKKDEIFPDQITNFITISAAKNEYESFQLVLLPFNGDLNHIEVELDDFEDETGKIISSNNVEISLVEYNHIPWQANYIHEKGWHPDPLIPVSGPGNLPGRDLCRPFWITVYVPDGTVAGNYSSKLTVTSAGVEAYSATINLKVWDFSLPLTSKLMTHTWDNLEYLNQFYDKDTIPVEWYLNFCNVLLKNRLNPSFSGVNYLNKTPKNGKYDFSTVEKILENNIAKGMTKFSLIQMRKGEYEDVELDLELAFIKAYSDFLEEKGWLNKALVELWDEPTVLEWESVKERANMIKNISANIPLQLFVSGGDPYKFWDEEASKKYGLTDVIDIWMPFHLIKAPALQEKGKEVWSYFCTLARSNAPNFYIDTPPIYQRSIPWYCWAYKVDGFEHWNTTYFWRNVHEGEPVEQKWPNRPWDSRTFHDFHGEGQLVYPGANGAFYPSIRLELFRDGMEDYEYLYRLSKLIEEKEITAQNPIFQQAQKLLNIEEYLIYQYPPDVQITLENTLRYPKKPDLILEMREKIAELIEALQKL